MTRKTTALYQGVFEKLHALILQQTKIVKIYYMWSTSFGFPDIFFSHFPVLYFGAAFSIIAFSVPGASHKDTSEYWCLVHRRNANTYAIMAFELGLWPLTFTTLSAMPTYMLNMYAKVHSDPYIKQRYIASRETGVKRTTDGRHTWTHIASFVDFLIAEAGNWHFNLVNLFVVIYLFAGTWYNVNNYDNSYMSRTTKLSSTALTAALFS